MIGTKFTVLIILNYLSVFTNQKASCGSLKILVFEHVDMNIKNAVGGNQNTMFYLELAVYQCINIIEALTCIHRKAIFFRALKIPMFSSYFAAAIFAKYFILQLLMLIISIRKLKKPICK